MLPLLPPAWVPISANSFSHKWVVSGVRRVPGCAPLRFSAGPAHFYGCSQKAGKEFTNGRADSIEFFFGIAGAFAKGRALAASMSPKHRLALKQKVANRKAADKGLKARIAAMSEDERNRWYQAVHEAARKRIAAARAECEAVEQDSESQSLD